MFKDKVIWITGASSGIGEALAKAYARRGAKLVLSGRREAALQAVAQACTPAPSRVIAFDMTEPGIIPAKTAEAWEAFGHIDLLFNNAGVSQRSTCLETSMETYRLLFEIDVFAQIEASKEILPRMIARGSGHLAVTSSVAGKFGVKRRTGYCAAKHAMMGFFDALRAEVAADNIKVTTVTPGYIRTGVSKNALMGDGSAFGQTDANIAKGMDPDACAEVIVQGMERGRPEIPVGDGPEMKALWLKRLAPRRLFRLVEQMG